MNEKFHPEVKEIADQLFLNNSEVENGLMFGYPAYYINKKLVACHYGNGLAIKLPEAIVGKLMSDKSFDAEPFCPMGKKMGKNWIILMKSGNKRFKLSEYVVQEAISFSLTQNKMKNEQ